MSVSIALCSCESSECQHPYRGVPAGLHRADYVGAVCDACASTHLRPYLLVVAP